MSRQPLKTGEKVLLIVSGIFVAIAVIGYVSLETYRIRSDKPVFVQRTFFDFSKEGERGSELYRKANCNACHRALRAGTSMGLILDGIGSKRSVAWLEGFLKDPESFYDGPTIDHGDPPKEAAYVASLPPEDLHLIAVFLSELRADAGSSVAKEPPPGKSEFIDGMIQMWAPDSWKEKYTDIRDRRPSEAAGGAGDD
ncbi:MAG TPA: c-type cytochrome [Gammaproteobacteria bacterium]|nr:c-type cytochrome [Gammaproteobacteria bacterium]